MQRLLSLFRRPQPVKLSTEPVKRPVVLDAVDLKKVGGGLPNVGGFTSSAVEAPPKFAE